MSRSSRRKAYQATQQRVSNIAGTVNDPAFVANHTEEHRVMELISNLYVQDMDFRNRMMGIFTDPRRNVSKECGYPETSSLSFENYYNIWEREPLAKRFNDIYPLECFGVNSCIYEDDDEEKLTPFEQAWIDVSKQVAIADRFGQESYFDGHEGNKLMEYLKLADIRRGIGHFGGVLLGLKDGKKLEEPAEKRDGQELSYVRALHEGDLQIAAIDLDPNSVRIGKPVMYNLKITQPVGTNTMVTAGIDVKVHWTRIVHTVDNPGTNEAFGGPRLLTPYNRLYSLWMLYGGSAEMYWRGAFFGLQVKMQPQNVGKVKAPSSTELTALKKSLENWSNGLDRNLLLGNLEAETMAPSTVDPIPFIDPQIEALCIELGCPKRIFMGSERGELSSNQDSRDWYAKCRDRCNKNITPTIIVPFVDTLINLGVLPAPVSFDVHWPDKSSTTDLEKAQILSQRTAAYAQFVSGNVDEMFDLKDYLIKEAGYDEDEAQTIIDNRMDSLADGSPLDGTREPQQVQFAPDGTPIGPDAKPLGPKMAPKPPPAKSNGKPADKPTSRFK